MRKLHCHSRFAAGGAVLAGLIFAAASGCQMGPSRSTATAKAEVPSMPAPFFPKEPLHFFSTKPEVEYSLTEEAQATRQANAVNAAKSAGAGKLASANAEK